MKKTNEMHAKCGNEKCCPSCGMCKDSFDHLHPFVIFWIGVLSGALFIGFTFFYGIVRNTDYQTSVLRYLNTYSTTISTATQAIPTTTITTMPKAVGGDKGGQ